MNPEHEQNLQHLNELLAVGDVGAVREFLNPLHPADIADLVEELDHDKRRDVFRVLTPEEASEVLVVVEEPEQADIIRKMRVDQLWEILEEMDSDDVADIISDLPDEKIKRVLQKLSHKDRVEVQRLMAYAEDTAGGIMQTEMVKVHLDAKISEAIKEIRRQHEEVEDIYNVFVVDRQSRLHGALNTMALIVNPPDLPVYEVMDVNPVSVDVNEDQEQVAALFKKYDVVSLPVTENGRLVGRILIDDILDVIDEEVNEDFLRMVGTEGEDIYSTSPFKSARIRLPWLFVNFLGGILASFIISLFEPFLDKAVYLAAFIPVITGMGGNIGTQSASLIIRGLAIGRVTINDWWRAVGREIAVAVLMAAFYGVLLGAVARYKYIEVVHLGVVVGLAIGCSMMMAALLGVAVPLFMQRIGRDPAVASTPFVSTTTDVLGITVYFTIAWFFFFD